MLVHVSVHVDMYVHVVYMYVHLYAPCFCVSYYIYTELDYGLIGFVHACLNELQIVCYETYEY